MPDLPSNADSDRVLAAAARSIIHREARHVRYFAEMRWKFLRDVNYALMAVAREAREQIERHGEAPVLLATIEWARGEQKKLWRELNLFAGPRSGSGEPSRWARTITRRYREVKLQERRAA